MAGHAGDSGTNNPRAALSRNRQLEHDSAAALVALAVAKARAWPAPDPRPGIGILAISVALWPRFPLRYGVKGVARAACHGRRETWRAGVAPKRLAGLGLGRRPVRGRGRPGAAASEYFRLRTPRGQRSSGWRHCGAHSCAAAAAARGAAAHPPTAAALLAKQQTPVTVLARGPGPRARAMRPRRRNGGRPAAPFAQLAASSGGKAEERAQIRGLLGLGQQAKATERDPPTQSSRGIIM